MTEELKTYKDFMAMKDHLEIDHTTLEELRAEAIKWIKAFQDKLDDVERLNLSNYYHCEVAYGTGGLHAIKEFFNLTDE